MITATFKDGRKKTVAYGLWQYDYGQVLAIEGLKLPETVQIHFSQQIDGNAVTYIGTTQNGITTVEIPDSLLEHPVDGSDERRSYLVHAWIYQTNGESGKTMYEITMPVVRRARPTDYNPEEEEIKTFDQIVTKMNVSAAAADDAAKQASAAAEGIRADREKISTNETEISGVKETIEKMKDQIADMQYEAISIHSFSNSINIAELGSTVDKVELKWDLNKAPESAVLDGNPVSGELKKQQSITIEKAAVKSDRVFTLSVTDERGATAKKNTEIHFLNGVYYGVSEIPSDMDSAFIRSLTKSLQSGLALTFHVTCGAGTYLWYALPARYGDPVFNVGGFDGGIRLVHSLLFQNTNGYSEEYKIYRSDNSNLGTKTVKVTKGA